MNPIIEDFLTHADLLEAVIGAASDADWTSPSPCQGWSAAAVFDHLVTTQREFLLRQEAAVGEAPTGTPLEIWAGHVAAVASVGADDAFVGREFDSYFGPTTIGATLRDFYDFDLIAHRWDLGQALGVEVTWSEQEMDHLDRSMEIFGDALHSDGVCAAAVEVPADARRQDQILGRLGRQPA